MMRGLVRLPVYRRAHSPETRCQDTHFPPAPVQESAAAGVRSVRGVPGGQRYTAPWRLAICKSGRKEAWRLVRGWCAVHLAQCGRLRSQGDARCFHHVSRRRSSGSTRDLRVPEGEICCAQKLSRSSACLRCAERENQSREEVTNARCDRSPWLA